MQKAYHWRIFTPANNQTIWPLQWWIIAPAFSVTLYLYANLMTRDYAVLHMESNPHRTQSEAKPVCTARISHPPPAEEAM